MTLAPAIATEHPYSRTWIHHLLQGGVTVLLVTQLVRYADLVRALILFPYQVMEAEGLLLAMGLSLLSGTSPYHDPSEPPWVVAPYAPLFAILTGMLASVTGATAVAGRIISLLATLGCALLLLVLTRREVIRLQGAQRSDLAPIALVVTAFITSPFVFEWSPLSRVDMLTLLLSLSSLACAGCWEPLRSRRALILAAGFCIAALWTKQTAIAAPASVIVWLWLCGHRWQAAQFGIAVVGISVLGYLALDTWSHGGFVDAAFLSNALPWWPRVLLNYLRRILLLYPWFLVMAGLFVLVQLRGRSVGLMALYLLVTVSSISASGHTGAAMNYFIEPLAACTIAAGTMLSRLRRHPRGIVGTATLALLGLQVSWFMVADVSPMAGFFGRSAEWGYRPSEQDRVEVERIERLARDRGGSLLSEDPLMNVRLGLPIVAVPSSALTALARYSDWHAGDLGISEALEQRSFNTVILTRGDYPSAVLAALGRYYEEIDGIHGHGIRYRVYVPT